VLHRRNRDQRDFRVVGVQKLQHVEADAVGERYAEQLLRGDVSPPQIAAHVHQYRRICQRSREISEIARESTCDRIRHEPTSTDLTFDLALARPAAQGPYWPRRR
jgi:hypothetical protein